MKKINFVSLVLMFLLTVLAFSTVSAQDDEFVNQKKAARPFRMMQELGLTREQVQQIRRINQERRPIMQDAARRWRQANRELDLAVYADNATEEEIKELLKAAQTAQAELLKERTQTEYLIRKVLTPEQLIKFRDLRRQLLESKLEERRNAGDEENQPNQSPRPFKRFPRRQTRAQ
jgi:Spy/CpxP family protein refolding chaperone